MKSAAKSRKKLVVLSIIAMFLVVLVIWTAWGNTALQLNMYTVEDEEIPAAFDGFRIAQVSDLHNAQMGENNAALVEMIANAKPDIIVITGDIADCNTPDIDVALGFVSQAVKIAPCYYTTGNHEAYLTEEDYGRLEKEMLDMGVTVLHNEAVSLEKTGEALQITGLDDPEFSGDEAIFEVDSLKALFNEEAYNVVLSHRPERFEDYVQAQADLVFSGHAHGGQFRLPFIGGLYAPNQGFLPEYDEGIYTEGETRMAVSRGIGNSVFPFRFNNKPEVLMIELKCSDQ